MTPLLPRVLFVGAFPPPGRQIFGGMVTSCGALLRSSFPQRAVLDLLDSTQLSNPPPALPTRLTYSVRRFARFVVCLERHPPDAVLLFAAIGASMVEKGAMAWYARLRGVPAVLFPRGGDMIDACSTSAFARVWVRVAFCGARKVFCQSQRWQAFAEHVLGFKREDAPVIPNWTATPALLAIGRARPPREVAPVRLLFLGWLDREKGVEELLAACVSLAPTREFSLDLAGEGNLSASARESVVRAGLSDRVRFRGWLQGPALAAALEAADVLVLPSWAEGLPNAMIEAMAAGLAIVVTRVGSIPDVVVDGEHALLVPPRDVAALELALGRIIDDSALRGRLARAGHALAATRFDVENAVDLMIAQFSALQRSATARRAV